MSKIVNLPRSPHSAEEKPPPAAKFRPARLPTFHIIRPLIAGELRIARGEIALLTGPAGCGKTTALAARHMCSKEEERTTLWVTLAPQDDSASAMARLLAAAFGAGAGAADLQPPDDCDLFIDGLELIEDPDARALIEGVLLDLPTTSRCYATSHALRGDVLHYGRLLGVVKLVPHDMFRFSEAEAARLLGGGWSPWEVRRLNQASDGWAAGLRFIALDPAGARKMLNDDYGVAAIPIEMAAYFDDVICSRLSGEDLVALMDASVLDRFTAEALADIPGRSCPWSLIEAHVRSGTFLQYLDSTRRWVTFHPAFGRHLRYRLRATDPQRFDALQKFAASWFQERGFTMEAIRHATKLSDTALAARIMEDAGGIVAELGRGPFVNDEKPVPIEQACDLPMVFLSQIYLQVRTGHVVEARQIFERFRRQTRGFSDFGAHPASHAVIGFARIIELVLEITEDRPVDDRRIASLEEMMARHIGTEPIIAASIASLLSMAYVEVCRFSEAATVCDIGLNAVRGVGATKVAIFIRIQQAAVALACETVSKAILYIEDGNRLAQAEGDFGRYEVMAVEILRAELHYEANELDAARALLEPALGDLHNVGGWVTLCATGFTVAARIAGIEGGYDAADACLRTGEQLARQRDLPRMTQLLLIARMRELVAGSRWRDASALLDQDDFSALIEGRCDTVPELRIQMLALLETARLMVEIGRPGDAATYLERVNKAYLDESDVRHRFTFRTLAMRVAFSLRRYNAAVDHMQVALDLSMQSGLLRRAITHRRALIEVFDWSIRNGRQLPSSQATFVNEVLRVADGTESGSAILRRRPRRGPATVTPNFMLSPRETEIMALIAEGYMTKEVATRLNISEGTVKSHRKKIHEKLGVASKSQAIARARELLII